MISESPDESFEKIAIDDPQAYIEVQQSEPVDGKLNCLDTFENTVVADDSDMDGLDPIYGFTPCDETILRSINRILDLTTFQRHCTIDSQNDWTLGTIVRTMKRNYTFVEDGDDMTNVRKKSRCTTPQRTSKRRR